MSPNSSLKVRVILSLSFLFSSYTLADQTEQAENSEDIVSEKDKVELVDDANLDEAVKRRPDLDFNNVSIDQENSGISLSTIPAQAVEKAEVMKAVTPDLDADTRGGILKVKLKPTYELSERVVNGRFYTRYKWIYDSYGWLGDVTWADRIGENAGIRLTAEAQDVLRGSDNFIVDWSDYPSSTINRHYIEGIDLLNSRRDYDTYRFNGSFDYRLSANSDMFFRVNYDANRVDNISFSTQVDYGDEADFESFNEDTATTSNGSILREGRHWKSKHESTTYTFGGSNKRPALEIDWRVQHNIHRDSDPFREIARFERDNTTLTYSNATTAFPTIVFPEPDSSAEYQLDTYDIETSARDHTTTIVAVDTLWQSGFLNEPDFFKFGIKASNNSSDISNVTDAYSIQTNTPITMSGLESGFRRDNFLDRGFSPGITPDARAVGNLLRTNPDVLVRDDFISALRSDPASYTVEEDITAAYAMLNWQLGKLRLLGGLRFERTELSAVGNEVLDTGSGFLVNQKVASSRYNNYFPGLHTHYELSPTLDIIASYTKTIKRPYFRDTAPYRSVETDDLEIEEGNPALRPTLFNNLDLAFDYKPNDDAMISWEWFYRDISDSIFLNISTVDSGPFAGYTREQLQNSGKSTLYGSKIIYQQELGAFSSALNSFAWNIAYTTNRSTAQLNQRPGEDLPLVEKPKHKLEAIFSFNKPSIFAQLIVNYQSDTLLRISSINAEKDIFESNVLTINFKGEYRLNEKLTVFLEWDNLTREYEEERYEGTTERPYEYKHDPWKILAGLRFEL